MHVGTAQSQSLISSISVSSTTQFQATSISQGGASADAVLLSIGRQIDVNYSQRVLETELGQQLGSALQDAGIEGQALTDVLSGVLDTSPEATAKRIVDFATSFFGAFQANHAEEGGEAQVSGFTDLIRDAVEEGFAQSRDILEGIGQISSGVSDDIDQTYDLVMQGIDDFAEGQRLSLAEQVSEASADPLEPVEDLLAI
jgi:hypothetical protein